MEVIRMNNVVPGAIDPEQHNGNHNENDDENSAVQESAKVLQESAKIASDSVNALADALLEPDGTLKDISDKKGREKLIESIDEVKARIDNLVKDINGIPKKIEKAIPSRVNAVLCDEDRKRFDGFQFRQFKMFLGIIIACFVLGIMGGSTLYTYFRNSNREDYLKQTQQDQQEIIDFGNDIRNHYPKTFDTWKEKRHKANEE